MSDDDETPVVRPAIRTSSEAEAFTDLQLALSAAAEECGRAAEGIDQVADADRADVVALFRRRVAAVKDRLVELLEGLGH